MNFQRVLFVTLLPIAASMQLLAADIKGRVTDQQTGEPLVGATVKIDNTKIFAVTDPNGFFSFSGLQNGARYNLTVGYVSYKPLHLSEITAREQADTTVVQMTPDETTLGGVQVIGRKNLESEKALQTERLNSNLAIENIGAKELSIKGISNVKEGVKKLTSISFANEGQLIVRGLGDRYSTTTLNGLPIASPNPDNKLIPLELFPSDAVRNITVSKVYGAEAFADYSGAHIDISTKDNVPSDFFSFGLSVGGKFNTIGRDSYRMDHHGLFPGGGKVEKRALDMPLIDFDRYVKEKDIFNTGMNVKRQTSLPEFGGSLGFGRNFNIGRQRLTFLASVNMENELQRMKDAYYKTLEATGTLRDQFNYDSYSNALKITGLGYFGTTLRTLDRLGYTFFYTRRAEETYQLRRGTDAERHDLTGSNSVTHIYSLQNHQLSGLHYFGDNDAWELTYGGSYSKTGSEEPDRRQMMFITDETGQLTFFKLNRQETMRYFGELDEEEWNASAAVKWTPREKSFIKLGVNYKDKDRDYRATRFYYNVNKINPEVTDIYHAGDYIAYDQIAAGKVDIQRVMQPKDSYRAGNEIFAAYALSDYYPSESLLINFGLRVEASRQWVEYATDGGERYGRRRNLSKTDLFPTLNLKYTFPAKTVVRFSVSRTVTRPSFVEMAPFLYQEAYGAAQIRGNEELKNGYNYNFDLRGEHFFDGGDMVSLTGYFKVLQSPIERVQTLQGGAALHSFRNADTGMAAGVEIEAQKRLFDVLKLGTNLSYMYTNVKLPEGGAYTTKERPLQGASPILLNADISYAPRLANNRQLNVSLLYNLQGNRIHAVGISGLGDVKQQALHTLNFVTSYTFNNHFSVKLKVNDLLNRDAVFSQEVPTLGKKVEVERYKKGTNFSIGLTYKL